MQADLEGFDEMLKVLKTLGDEKKIQSILRRTNKEALKPIQSALKGLPYSPTVKKNFKILAAKVDGKRHPNAVAVGPTTEAAHIRFVNSGTVERYTKSGHYTGKIVGKKMVEAIYDTEGQKLIDTVSDKYKEDLVKVTAKDVKRINRNK